MSRFIEIPPLSRDIVSCHIGIKRRTTGGRPDDIIHLPPRAYAEFWIGGGGGNLAPNMPVIILVITLIEVIDETY